MEQTEVSVRNIVPLPPPMESYMRDWQGQESNEPKRTQ